MHERVPDPLKDAKGKANTFTNLIKEVQKTGLCSRCGACVSFCTAVNNGALCMDTAGRPVYADPKKCIKCGICHMICPARHQLEAQTRQLIGWSAPMGRVMDVSVAHATDGTIRDRGTDGGVVTALLLRWLDTGCIDGAIVTQRVGLFQHQPYLACTHQQIVEAAGSFFNTRRKMAVSGDRYTTFSASVQAFKSLAASGLRRIAFVGVPCQIKAMRKMQVLEVLPVETVQIVLGLFCAGQFDFSESKRLKLEKMGGFKWENATHINLREELQIQLKSGDTVRIPVEQLHFIRRTACKYCQDYTAEFADLSFGGVGAPENWTTVLMRTPVGRAAFEDALGSAVQEFRLEDNPHFARQALQKVQTLSDSKKEKCEAANRNVGKYTASS